eukprot:COSAG01_NODE_17573_length_1139_cov_13.132692_2_plen_170_part_00
MYLTMHTLRYARRNLCTDVPWARQIARCGGVSPNACGVFSAGDSRKSLQCTSRLCVSYSSYIDNVHVCVLRRSACVSGIDNVGVMHATETCAVGRTNTRTGDHTTAGRVVIGAILRQDAESLATIVVSLGKDRRALNNMPYSREAPPWHYPTTPQFQWAVIGDTNNGDR